MANKFQLKRTSTPGKAPNTENISVGELALNISDGILYSTNGSVVFEIGANNTNVQVSNTLTISKVSANGSLGSNGEVLTSNGTTVYWSAPLISSKKISNVNNETTVIDSYSSAIKTTKYIIQIENENNIQSNEILLINDGTNIYLTEYAVLISNTPLGLFSANLNSGAVELICTPSFSNNIISLTKIDVV